MHPLGGAGQTGGAQETVTVQMSLNPAAPVTVTGNVRGFGSLWVNAVENVTP